MSLTESLTELILDMIITQKINVRVLLATLNFGFDHSLPLISLILLFCWCLKSIYNNWRKRLTKALNDNQLQKFYNLSYILFCFFYFKALLARANDLLYVLIFGLLLGRRKKLKKEID